MQKLTITINMSNDAFHPEPEREVARILHTLADEMEHQGQVPEHAMLRDENGNGVGEVILRENRQGRR